MNTMLVILVAFVVTIAALAMTVAVRDRRRVPAGYSGRRHRPSHLSRYDRVDGVSAYGMGGFGGGFDGSGGYDGGGGGGDGGGGGN